MAKDELDVDTGVATRLQTDVQKAAKSATDAVTREANAVVVGASDHPYTATGMALTVGALGFCIGFLLGRSSAESPRYWR
ncbi:ElaB/YqjD/DUF883 family membrane-anchored ribosome-binding protein [Rhizobium sp. BK313]|uniref:hypothetical protein n=1 Tax=Rhizobium sp. BK313 TaxID=2587081 RepID=UPI0010618FC2|nr:hypothetical protein [Rhizobium sp. BK313]MBB3458673.1 ElaB/YqjD/DUF883 family membrane-anchored ribosome-binding protein [Rhizobium sp. BK313]